MTTGLHHTHHLEPGQPEKRYMFKCLPRHDHIDTATSQRQAVGRLQHQINIGPRSKINAAVLPARTVKDRTVAAIYIITADIKDTQRLVAIKKLSGTRRHVFIRTFVHEECLKLRTSSFEIVPEEHA